MTPSVILVINPGSTSTKLALFEGGRCVRAEEAPHAPLPPGGPARVLAEVEGRAAAVHEFLSPHEAETLDAVAARGGFLPRGDRKLLPGTYAVAEVVAGEVVVDEALVRAVVERPERPHASNLGIPLAAGLARRFGVPAYVVDPVVADEFCPEAQLSGYAPIRRRSVAHVLSVRAAARRVAEKSGSPLDQTTYVVAHLGGGITVAAVRGGRMVDNTIALLGEGPFTPQRAGALPLLELIDLCYSGRFTRDELIDELSRRGGLRSYLGEHRMEAIEERIAAGDERARQVVEAMAYQIAKSIGAMSVAAGPETEAIILTGGLSRSALVVAAIKKRLSHLIPVIVLKDTPEMQAMAEGVCRVLSGHEQARRYAPPRAESGP